MVARPTQWANLFGGLRGPKPFSASMAPRPNIIVAPKIRVPKWLNIMILDA